MIRDRFKKAARRAAIKIFNMEFDTEERDPNARGVADPNNFDPTVIPKLVDGDGDTPGPNHRYDIGRTWVSAQLVGGVPPFFIDIRPPDVAAAGILPGAILMSGDAVKQRTNRLPADRAERVTIYDQTGELGSAEIAAWLREQGWTMARRLQGGYAEWLEQGETISQLDALPNAPRQIGQPVKLTDGRNGHIHSVEASGSGFSYSVWVAGTVEGPLGDDALAD
ncbi:MAG: rhodanese-like domain-containing protein [Myxococcota bacterium]|nr:rhodanese-like domain-containing protein [Myxococcota bacterium]